MKARSGDKCLWNNKVAPVKRVRGEKVMYRRILCVAAAAFLAACGPKVEKVPDVIGAATTSLNGETQAAEAAAPELPAGFKVEPLGEGEGDVQGCQTMLSGEGDGDIFRASAADTDASGFIKIDGTVVKVDLVSSEGDEKSHVRSYESADKKTTVVENLTTGEAHPESDSVEQSGVLDVTHNGEKQSLEVKGGTAC